MAWGCDVVILVVPTDRVSAASREVGETIEVVEGGATRQASVANGLRLVGTDKVLVHDAARPFVDKQTIDALIPALADRDAVVPVVPVGETIKEVSGNIVLRTVDRGPLALSQTPQAFRTEELIRAHDRARNEGYESTDDAELIERVGGSVATVMGSPRNIKLTYPEDFAIAEAMIGS